MLETMKARGGSGDPRASEDVHAGGRNASLLATNSGLSQRLIGYRVDPCLRVQPLFREVANG
jgi:hypothetical protein